METTTQEFTLSQSTAAPATVQMFNFILNRRDPIVLSWGIDADKIWIVDTTTTEDFNGETIKITDDALIFWADGYEYSGAVMLQYNRAADTLSVYKIKGITAEKCTCELWRDDVYIDSVRSVLDAMIESGGNTEAYEKKINEQTKTDPLYMVVSAMLRH